MKTTFPEAFYTVLVLHVIVHVATFAALILRRNEFPLSGRVVWLRIPIQITFAGYGAFHIVDAFADTVCVTKLLFEALLVFPGLIAEILLLLRLWVFYYAAEETLKIRDAKARALLDSDVKVPTPWFTSRKKYFRFRYLGVVFAVPLLLHTIATVLVYALSVPDPDLLVIFHFEPCNTIPHTFGLLYCTFGFTVIALFVTTWKIRNVSDGYFIVTEQKLDALSAATVVGARFYVDYAPVVPGEFAVQKLLVAIACALGIITFLVYPIYKGFSSASGGARPSNQMSQSRSQVIDMRSFYRLSMKTVLTDPMYADEKRSLLRHIAKEFAVDQFLFYEAATEFAKHACEWDDEMVCARALEIHDTYIRADADQEANISGKLRTQISAELEAHVSDFGSNKLFALKSPTTCAILCGGCICCPHMHASSMYASDYKPAINGAIDHNVFEDAKTEVYRILSLGTYVRWQAKYAEENRVDADDVAIGSAGPAAELAQQVHLSMELEIERPSALSLSKVDTQLSAGENRTPTVDFSRTLTT